ncbi:MAG: hypothetical protein AMXMBFR76_12620 [Pseudomonadota bacterium]
MLRPGRFQQALEALDVVRGQDDGGLGRVHDALRNEKSDGTRLRPVALTLKLAPLEMEINALPAAANFTARLGSHPRVEGALRSVG